MFGIESSCTYDLNLTGLLSTRGVIFPNSSQRKVFLFGVYISIKFGHKESDSDCKLIMKGY